MMNHFSQRSLILLLLVEAPSTKASTFYPISAQPPPGTNYISAPNIRSTTAILFNCLSIIFLCTWNIRHLNVPAARPEAKATAQDLIWSIADARIKLKWMIFTMLVPEILIGKALGERLAAMAGVKFMTHSEVWSRSTIQRRKEIVDRGKSIQWEEIHAYMANIVYFVIDFGEVLEDHKGPFQVLTREFRNQYSSEINIYPSWNINLRRLEHRCWAVNNIQLRLAFELGLIDVPHVPARHLRQLDRGNGLVKALALLQIIYLIVQLLSRRAKNLPSTQLEIATLAYASLSIVTYLLYWSRPQGVEGVHIIKAKKMPDIEMVEHMINHVSSYLWTFCRCESTIDEELDLVPLPNDSGYVRFDALDGWFGKIFGAVGFNKDALPLAYGVVAGSSLFSALHCLAWKLDFPTLGEALVWKICSVLTTLLPVLSIVPFVIWQEGYYLSVPLQSLMGQ